MAGVRAVRAYLRVESDGPVAFHTAKIVKTLLYTLFREARLYRGLRGVVSPIHVSPLFRPGRREWELGELVTARYTRGEDGYKLEPAALGGVYLAHIGGAAELVEGAMRALERLRTPLQVKIGDALVVAALEGARDVTPDIMGKELSGDRVTVYLKAPVKLFNVFTPTRLPKYSISAVELLMTPYMFHTGRFTMTEAVLLEASRLLGLMVETYYSISTVRYMQVPLGGGRDPGMVGKITYIIDTSNPNARSAIADILRTAEAVGVGESRANGFGTVAWTPK